VELLARNGTGNGFETSNQDKSAAFSAAIRGATNTAARTLPAAHI